MNSIKIISIGCKPYDRHKKNCIYKAARAKVKNGSNSNSKSARNSSDQYDATNEIHYDLNAPVTTEIAQLESV